MTCRCMRHIPDVWRRHINRCRFIVVVFLSHSAIGSFGVRSTGCWWVLVSRFVSPSGLSAPCVWTSTAVPPPTRSFLQRSLKPDPRRLRIQPLPFQLKLSLNTRGQRRSRCPHRFPPPHGEGGLNTRLIINVVFVWPKTKCLHMYKQ